MQLAITSTSGTEKGRHLPPTLHCCYQCLSTACWSTDPVPAAPFVQCSLRQPYQIRRLFPPLACTKRLFAYCTFHIATAVSFSFNYCALWVQAVTSCSGSTFYPQFHGNLWHFQDVTSTFFTSGKETLAAPFHLAKQKSFITTPVYPSCFLFITNVNLNAFTLEMELIYFTLLAPRATLPILSSWSSLNKDHRIRYPGFFPHSSSILLMILCSKAPISSNTIRVKSFP